MSHGTTAEHHRLAAELVREMRAHDGLAPLDLERFYADQEVAGKAPFGAHIPQCPLGIWMSGECVYAELGIAEDFWRYGHDDAWRLELNKAYNDRSERIVGKRLLSETPGAPADRQYPPHKVLHDIFEAKNVWHSGSWWLEQVAHNPDELRALLDRVDRRLEHLAEFVLAPNWQAEYQRLQALGVKPPRYRGQRGPVTFATSIYGPENLLFLIMDEPDLARRFSDTIRRAMLALGQVLDDAAGDPTGAGARGFGFADDNCCLLNPEMYALFGYPVLKAMFERYAPNPGDSRYQHSDSAMGHLLPQLGSLGMTGLNLGPTVMVREIRRHCPLAVIYGQLAPFTFSRNEEEHIVAEFIRDFEQAREHRGLVFATAGSINNGSRLTGMRLIMAAIQRYGRF
jgi:uroporphyrinogen decarboxylase